jgi:hypothetical protein
VGGNKNIYAYTREKGGKKVFVVLNLSAMEIPVVINDKSLLRNTHDIFAGKKIVLNKSWVMEPWGYKVYEY